jgi:hypothetical protein
MRTAAAAVATLPAVLGAAPAHADDPTPSPAPQIPTQDGPVLLPGNQVLPPICGVYMRGCGFTYDPGAGTWGPSAG